MMNNGSTELVKYTDEWLGYRNGVVVARYPNRWTADRALIAREVDMVAPERQP